MNTGENLEFSECILPSPINEKGVSNAKFLQIRGILVDELSNEPIVIEIT